MSEQPVERQPDESPINTEAEPPIPVEEPLPVPDDDGDEEESEDYAEEQPAEGGSE